MTQALTLRLLTLFENEQGFDRLKRLVPHIQQITLTDEDLAAVRLSDSQK